VLDLSVAPAAHSRFVTRVRRRYGDALQLLPPGLPTLAHLTQTLHHLQHTPVAALSAQAAPVQGLELGAALRVLRQLVLERLAVLDCEQACPMPAVGQVMTALAEFAVQQAHAASWRSLVLKHGEPLVQAPPPGSGQHQARTHAAAPSAPTPATLWVLGMGKLGGRELNVSSDMDLIYVYDADGETAGIDATPRPESCAAAATELPTRNERTGKISNAEFFVRMVRSMHTLLGDVTEHGFVFRLDLALRPNGNAGAVALSLASLAGYLQAHGREWERFAWLKSRVIAPPAPTLPAAAARARAAHPLRQVVQPFVFRHYLDYKILAALRQLHSQIRQHAQSRAAGRPERLDDVKLGRGGIRELEFSVQCLQVVRGGQCPELRRRNTLQALPCLVQAGLLPAATEAALAHAYTFLRRVEHRIQYLDDQQTHLLPTADADRAWLAQGMGFARVAPFLAALQHHRDQVAAVFDALLHAASPLNPGQSGTPSAPDLAQRLARGSPQAENTARSNDALAVTASTSTQPALPAHHSPAVQARLQALAELPRVQTLSAATRAQLDDLIARSLAWQSSDVALLHFVDWLQSLLGRTSHLALLMERPAVHQRVLRLLGASRWSARYVQQHPSVVDELAQAAWLDERFDPAHFVQTLQLRHQALARSGQDDEESLLNVLRRAQHAASFCTLTRDLEGRLSVPQVADELSALADAVLQVAIPWCWQHFKGAHQPAPQLAVMAYGKLGGRELGHGSDLDLVFVFDDAHPDAREIYASFVRKLLHWLSVKTSAGALYDIDTALRPNGNAGLLVTSLQAFSDYQLQRSANAAWVWEHQAMSRARCAAGDTRRLAKPLEALRRAVLCAPRDPAALRAQIAAMRTKLHQAHPAKAGVFDIKHGAGGMIDVEFAVQCLVLSHAAQHPELRHNSGNQALLLAAEKLGLIPSGTGQAASQAYAQLRAAQHQARLDERPATTLAAALSDARASVSQLWALVFAL
jgi:[glutamine synthetase] adenylyltransferase / [glutamine synthetase]-adenylyl-L-tyrosine phosphorylase